MCITAVIVETWANTNVRWTLVWKKCTEYLRQWTKDKKSSLNFRIPMILREPINHATGHACNWDQQKEPEQPQVSWSYIRRWKKLRRGIRDTGMQSWWQISVGFWWERCLIEHSRHSKKCKIKPWILNNDGLTCNWHIVNPSCAIFTMQFCLKFILS